MSGLYIHIPYCKKVCYYCDFHFSTAMKNKDKCIAAIIDEFDIRKGYLLDKKLNSIYFGGGTPSILNLSEISGILDTAKRYFSISPDVEITFEANPDDITRDYLNDLLKAGINRLSIGVQSFNDSDLLWMNRRHDAKEAENSIKLSQDSGFTNINIDLIYGLPESDVSRWMENLEKFASFNVPHLSAYHLSIEPKTVFGVWKKRGKISEVAEEKSLEEYEKLIEVTKKEGYLHYEISNFCKNDTYSKHNLNYWNQGLYLGLGPSAHSYNGYTRQWNIALNDTYISKIEKKQDCFENEILTRTDKFNDYIITHLRTCWGINFSEIRSLFGEIYYLHLKKGIKNFVDSDLVIQLRDEVKLSDKGMFVSDSIIEKLIYP